MPTRSFRIGRSLTGLGLFATKPIEKKAYIATYRGRLITNAEAEARERRGGRYLFELNSRWTIDGSSRWNLARYANHSCRPNAEAVERKRKIVLIARRRIKPGEEITYDYGREYFDAYIKKSGCRCAKCREKRAARRRKAKGGAARAKTHKLAKAQLDNSGARSRKAVDRNGRRNSEQISVSRVKPLRGAHRAPLTR